MAKRTPTAVKRKPASRKQGGARRVRARGLAAPARRAAGAAVMVPNKPVLVVNMIPQAMSFEEHQDSEPMLAVNAANPMQIAGCAFTPDPGEGNLAPIYVSIDGGNTWVLNSIVPSAAPDSDTADISLAFGAGSQVLYAGIIRRPIINDRTRLNILSTTNFLGTTKMKVLVDRTGEGVDQPFVQATTVPAGADKGKDRVYVGSNDFNAVGGRTATIDLSANAASNAPGFKVVRIDSRKTSGQDGPSVRPAIHDDGTIYAVLHAWRTFDPSSGNRTADIVVVRDDDGGKGTSAFTALVDPADGKAGMRVVQNSRFNFDDSLGLERTGGAVSVAVDPTNSSTVLRLVGRQSAGRLHAAPPAVDRSRQDMVRGRPAHDRERHQSGAGRQLGWKGRVSLPAADGFWIGAALADTRGEEHGRIQLGGHAARLGPRK